MKKVIYISILILIIQLIPLGITYSQPHPIWQRFYTSPYELITIDVSVADSGNFYLINRYGSNNARIIKINAYGDTLWNRFDIHIPASAVSSGDGSCVITFQSGALGKINPSGNYVWYKTYDSLDLGIPSKIIKSSSNTYLICGGWGVGSGTIFEIDSLGNKIWQNFYPGGYYKIYYSICEANNGGYIAVGILVVSGWDYGYGVIDRIDGAGNLIWEKTYWQNGSGTQFHSIDKCPGGYILGGQGYDSSANLDGMYIIKIDTSGSKIFSKFISAYNSSLYYGFNDLNTINNNKFIIYGGFGDTSFWYPKLIISDFNGNILDSNTIYTNADFYRGITINNNDFIVVGDYGYNIYTYGYAMRFDTNLNVPPIGIKKIAKNEPASFQLYQNYPNPFNPTTKIKYEIPSPILTLPKGEANVTLKIYDILGREVATLVNEKQNAGKYSVDFNGTNLSSGIYFYSLIVNDKIIESKKMILLK